MIFHTTVVLVLIVIILYIYINHYNTNGDDENDNDNEIIPVPVTLKINKNNSSTGIDVTPSSTSDPIATAPDTTKSSAPKVTAGGGAGEGYIGVNYNDEVQEILDPNIYAENIMHQNLKGTNIMHTHKQFAESVKPNTHQPSRLFERDDYQDPNTRHGFPRNTPFLNIDRTLPGRTIPSQGWDNMYYGATLSLSKKDDYSNRATVNAPKEVY